MTNQICKIRLIYIKLANTRKKTNMCIDVSKNMIEILKAEDMYISLIIVAFSEKSSEVIDLVGSNFIRMRKFDF